MNKSESIKEIASALVKAQGEMRGAKKAADNPFFKSKYADLSEVIDAARKPLQDNGLSFSQFPISREIVGDSRLTIESKGTKTETFVSFVGVETILMHESGEWMSNESLLAVSKQDPQGYGSAITYARRYSLQAILGIPSEDDDANTATHSRQTVSSHSAPPQEQKSTTSTAPASDKQKGVLDKYNIGYDPSINKTEASALIDKAFKDADLAREQDRSDYSDQGPY